MTVALKCEKVVTEIGPGGVLHSLFSTIAVRLESGQWGSRFPLIMGQLYGGKLADAQATAALEEFSLIAKELAQLPPTSMVWDAETPDAKPPWGPEVGPHVTNVAQYFVTTGGRLAALR
jgi:2,3-bisphosphoglycerate-dependent phosphoglycerate mutase